MVGYVTPISVIAYLQETDKAPTNSSRVIGRLPLALRQKLLQH